MKDEIIIYQPDEQSITLEVRIEEDTVWLTQAQMADLFHTTRNNITLHISNIFKESELVENSVGKESLLTASDLSKRRENVCALIYTSNFTKQLRLDLKKHNEQYPAIEIKAFDKSHDRFIIIDNESVYHIGASL